MCAITAKHILDIALRSSDGMLDILILEHDPKFASILFREFNRRNCSSLLFGLAFHKNMNAMVERVNGVVGDTLRA